VKQGAQELYFFLRIICDALVILGRVGHLANASGLFLFGQHEGVPSLPCSILFLGQLGVKSGQSSLHHLVHHGVRKEVALKRVHVGLKVYLSVESLVTGNRHGKVDVGGSPEGIAIQRGQSKA